MYQYYWKSGHKIELQRIPGSFGMSIATPDLVSRITNHYEDQGYKVVQCGKNKLLITKFNLKLNDLRSQWSPSEVCYITNLYQDNKDKIFPTDELRILSKQLCNSELKSLAELGTITSVTKMLYHYECKIISPNGDQGLKAYQQIYEVLKLPVTINFARLVPRPGPKPKR